MCDGNTQLNDEILNVGLELLLRQAFSKDKEPARSSRGVHIFPTQFWQCLTQTKDGLGHTDVVRATKRIVGGLFGGNDLAFFTIGDGICHWTGVAVWSHRLGGENPPKYFAQHFDSLPGIEGHETDSVVAKLKACKWWWWCPGFHFILSPTKRSPRI